MPPQPELDKLVQEMLTTQGMNEKAAAAVMGSSWTSQCRRQRGCWSALEV
jgi:hypothetical protein